MASDMLKDKVAVIYGAGGAIGGAVARAFAAEGAELFLTGRRRAAVEAVAGDLGAAAAEVDALDERAIDAHLASVVDAAGRVDISFNAIGIPDAGILGVPLTELDAGQFALPIADYATSYFLTARLAARRMIPRRSGVIMTVTALLARTGARWWAGTVRRWPRRSHSPATCRPSSHRRASAWSGCDRRRCRRRRRSRRPSSRAPGRRG